MEQLDGAVPLFADPAAAFDGAERVDSPVVLLGSCRARLEKIERASEYLQIPAITMHIEQSRCLSLSGAVQHSS